MSNPWKEEEEEEVEEEGDRGGKGQFTESDPQSWDRGSLLGFESYAQDFRTCKGGIMKRLWLTGL